MSVEVEPASSGKGSTSTEVLEVLGLLAQSLSEYGRRFNE